jgi:multidrug transporter EmrE-like cation transporter
MEDDMLLPSGEPAGWLAGMQPRYLVLVLLSAIGYAIATIGMKLASNNWTLVAVAIIVAGFVAATLAEVVLLKKADLGVIYVTIVGAETLMVLAFAAAIGEAPDLRTVAGAALVVAGIVLVTH